MFQLVATMMTLLGRLVFGVVVFDEILILYRDFSRSL